MGTDGIRWEPTCLGTRPLIGWAVTGEWVRYPAGVGKSTEGLVMSQIIGSGPAMAAVMPAGGQAETVRWS